MGKWRIRRMWCTRCEQYEWFFFAPGSNEAYIRPSTIVDGLPRLPMSALSFEAAIKTFNRGY